VYGGLRFFERQEIKHALAYLRLVSNPEDDGAFLRVVNFPTRGVGARSIELLQDAANQQGTSLWQAACSHPVGGKAGTAIVGFIRLVEDMRRDCLGLGLTEMIDRVVQDSGLLQHYQTEREGTDRLENLRELTNAAASFSQEDVFADVSPEGETSLPVEQPTALATFLAHASLEAGEHQAIAGTDALQLMTVHSAKGLEFHAVFISGLEEGLFPHENSLSEDDGLEEERRLMYVALTRARRRLYLTFAQSRMLHGQTRYNVRSRFLDELPAELLKQVGEVKPAFSARASMVRVVEHAGGLRIGQSVVHPKFGSGVIIGTEGRGSDARVHVSFRDAGMKWLALDYARLTPA
jgi:DNA helicase-2/ATP-dependent DNA helicase PcrA